MFPSHHCIYCCITSIAAATHFYMFFFIFKQMPSVSPIRFFTNVNRVQKVVETNLPSPVWRAASPSVTANLVMFWPRQRQTPASPNPSAIPAAPMPSGRTATPSAKTPVTTTCRPAGHAHRCASLAAFAIRATSSITASAPDPFCVLKGGGQSIHYSCPFWLLESPIAQTLVNEKRKSALVCVTQYII